MRVACAFFKADFLKRFARVILNSRQAMPHNAVKHNYFFSATLAPKESYGHRPLITDLPH